MKRLRNLRKWIIFGCLALAGLGFAGVKYLNAWNNRVTPERLAMGREIFEHKWETGDSMSAEGDGLGPVFNEQSCVACHFQGGVGGGGPNEFNVLAFETLPTARQPELFGGVIHAQATQAEWLEESKHVQRLFPVVKGGVRIVDGCQTQEADFNPVVYSNINTTALFGAGLIDAIPDRAISGNGVSRTINGVNRSLDGDFKSTPVGRARLATNSRIGKFGWKGQFGTLEDFVAAACAVELGLTNPHRAQVKPKQFVADEEAKLDLDNEQFRSLVCFVAELPRPVEILPDDPKQRQRAIHGKKLFSKIGCCDCHTPNIGGVEGVYSDFRLYVVDDYERPMPKDIKIPESHPKPGEWKTPPLWGVADSAPYFHDGSAKDLMHAIMRHDGQAVLVRNNFENLNWKDQKAVVAFLETLRAPRVSKKPAQENLAAN